MTEQQTTRLIEALENIGIELAATNYLLAQQNGISLAVGGTGHWDKANTIATHCSETARIVKERATPLCFDK